MRSKCISKCGAAWLIMFLLINCSNAQEESPRVEEQCVSKYCVTKCCPYGETLAADKTCKPSPRVFYPCFTLFKDATVELEEGEDYPDSPDLVFYCNGTDSNGDALNNTDSDDFNIIVSNNCHNNRYRLEPFADITDRFYLLPNGTLYVPLLYTQALNYNEYCMETFLVDDEELVLPLVCFPPKNNVTSLSVPLHFILYPIGLLVSVPFLVMTFLVYNLVTKLRDLHGKSLSCYVFCLSVAYVCLAVVQLGGQNFDQEVCVTIAFAIQFSFIGCFFWLNVLCFDIWRNVTFHGGRTFTMSKPRERRYFIGYSIYAWCSTFLCVLVTIVLNFSPTIPADYLTPRIGESTCWFETDKSAFPFFYGPVSILLFLNVVLFISTAIKLVHDHHQQRSEVARTPKQTFRLCVTLFFLMGVTWVTELVSWVIGGASTMWYVTDILNTLQGIIIFVVFVAIDRRVRDLISSQFPWVKWFPCFRPRNRIQRGNLEMEIFRTSNEYRFKTTDTDPEHTDQAESNPTDLPQTARPTDSPESKVKLYFDK